jgi:hypothetical protein
VDPVRVIGRELRNGIPTRFQRNGLDGPITDEMVVENPRRETMRPAGAPLELLNTDACYHVIRVLSVRRLLPVQHPN